LPEKIKNERMPKVHRGIPAIARMQGTNGYHYQDGYRIRLTERENKMAFLDFFASVMPCAIVWYLYSAGGKNITNGRKFLRMVAISLTTHLNYCLLTIAYSTKGAAFVL
jgi:hypothetical protein